MKVIVDFDACDSNAVCEALAPDTFEVDDDDFLQIIDPTVTDANVASIQRAVAACPKQAISMAAD